MKECQSCLQPLCVRDQAEAHPRRLPVHEEVVAVDHAEVADHHAALTVSYVMVEAVAVVQWAPCQVEVVVEVDVEVGCAPHLRHHQHWGLQCVCLDAASPVPPLSTSTAPTSEDDLKTTGSLRCSDALHCHQAKVLCG